MTLTATGLQRSRPTLQVPVHEASRAASLASAVRCMRQQAASSAVLAAGGTALGGSYNAAAAAMAAVAQASALTGPRLVRCDVCNATFAGDADMQQHLQARLSSNLSRLCHCMHCAHRSIPHHFHM